MPEQKKRGPLVLARGVRNTLAGSTLARAARGQRRHVIAAGETKALYGIDPATWREKLVEDDKLVTCPLCAEVLKAPAAFGSSPGPVCA